MTKIAEKNKTPNSTLKSTPKCEVNTHLDTHYEIKLNEFSYQTEYRSLEGGKLDYLRDYEVCEMWDYAHRSGLKCSKAVLETKIAAEASRNRYNPIKLFFEGLKEVKEEGSSIEKLASLFVLENDTPEELKRLIKCLKHWFVSAVRSVYEADYTPKRLIVFLGPQGIGKTPFITSWLPKKIRRYGTSTESFDPKNKDKLIEFSTNLILRIDEINDFLSVKANRKNFKAITSNAYVTYRPYYGKHAIRAKRVASIVASCNESTFLNDPSGEDRFMVFALEALRNKKYLQRNSISDEACEDFDFRTVWKWAYEEFRKGEFYELTALDEEANSEANEQFKYNSDDFELLRENIFPASKDEKDALFMTSSQIAGHLENVQLESFGKIKIQVNGNQIGKHLIRLKFKKVSVRDGEKCRRGYWVKKQEKAPQAAQKQESREHEALVKRYERLAEEKEMKKKAKF